MPIQKISSIPVKIHNAIDLASKQTNTSFDYLLNTAKRESSLRTQAKSSTSTAAGLFQFVEGTWLKVVKEDGDRLGLSDLAKNIKKTSSGRYYVPDGDKRREILAMRHDEKTSALVAAAYTEHNERYVGRRIGRSLSDGELYLAHFLGPGSAARMISLAEQKPDNPANRYFPSAARSNKSIFYENGQARTVADVYNILISSHVDENNSNIRQTNKGAFGFGLSGGIMGNDSDDTTGLDGSIGVWGDLAKGNSEASRSRTKEQGANPTDIPVTSASAPDAEQHRAASQAYAQGTKTAQSVKETTDAAKPASKAWMDDAFGKL